MTARSANEKLAKWQKRRAEREAKIEKIKKAPPVLNLSIVEPLTPAQHKVFKLFSNPKNHLFLHGCPGTGKTYLALFLALQGVLTEGNEQEKIVVCRSVVPSREIGFLPGSLKEKTEQYEHPYIAICRDLFHRDDAYTLLKSRKQIDFLTTSFNRGITLSNCYLIIEEAQNMTASELHLMITRVGEGCRVIICGDIRQTDLDGRRQYSGLRDFIKIVKEMESFSFVEFGYEDIIRSGLVREYIMVRDRLEHKKEIDAI